MECDSGNPSLNGLLDLRAGLARSEEWMEVLPKGVRKALVSAIQTVENGAVPNGLHLTDLEEFVGWERCGLLYWWPTEWNVATGEWVVELRSMHVPNEDRSASSFRIDPVRGYGIQESVAVECVRLRGDISAMPYVFFGTWHTHPSGTAGASPQDLLGEVDFEVWRSAMGTFPLGSPRSFVFGMDGTNVSSVLAYGVFGPIKSWTRN